MVVKIEIQGKGEMEIECESFDLKEAVGIMNGTVRNEDKSKPAGFMVGENHYFRALEVVSIEVFERLDT